MANAENNLSLFEFRNVSKYYGRVPANDSLCFSIRSGTIHAIIGENGAGKTTAMKLLFGLESPTSGEILYKGQPKTWGTPKGALDHGIGMVHQHFMLSPEHTALDNVILGQEFGRGIKKYFLPFRKINRIAAQKKLRDLADSVGFEINWDKKVSEISVGTQQQLEIMKLLYAGVDTMIFDEPTAVLAPGEKAKFLQLLKMLNESGKTIIIITHKLHEVKEIADEVTVFRRGKSITSRRNSELSIQEMADLMVGRPVRLEEIARAHYKPGDDLIDVRNLTVSTVKGRQILKSIDFCVRAGEVVGIAGVEGSGQSELWNFLCGPKDYLKDKSMSKGTYRLFNCDALEMARTDVRTRNLAIIPFDRLKEAVLVAEDLVENDLLGHDKDFYVLNSPIGAWLDRVGAKSRLDGMLAAFDVRPTDSATLMGSLSGGNQQKFVIGREFSRNPRLIFCAEPTRGVDVGSVEKIHQEIIKRRDSGAGVVLVSSQIEELIGLADRIYVMFDGAIVSEFARGDFSESHIGRAMGGIAQS